MGESNLEIVRALTDAFRAGNRHELLERFAQDVVWDVSSGPALGEAVYHGREGVARFFGDWLQAWDEYEFRPTEIFPAGHAVVVIFEEHGRGRGSGIQLSREFIGVYTLRDGKVAHFKTYPTREEAVAAGTGGRI